MEEVTGLTIQELGIRTDQNGQMRSPFSSILSDLKTAFQNDFTVEQACHYAKISKDTFYRWIKESDEFRDHMEIAQTDLVRRAKKVLTDAVQSGDKESSKWLLERREKKNYSPRQEIGGEDGPLEIIIKRSLSEQTDQSKV